MARETGGGSRGCGSDSALGRGMTSQNVAQKRGHREDRRIANRSAISERAAQGNLSQFNSLDLVVPWFGTRRSMVQIHSPDHFSLCEFELRDIKPRLRFPHFVAHVAQLGPAPMWVGRNRGRFSSPTISARTALSM
jgi:hypothetical protein